MSVRAAFPLALVTFLLVTSSARELTAQVVTLDARGTGAIPIQRLAGTELEAGIGFGATVAISLDPRLSIYGGWDWVRLTATEPIEGADRRFEDSGYTLGVRVEHPPADRIHYRLEGGVTRRRVAIESDGGAAVGDSEPSWGFEASAGLVMSLSQTWKMTPSARYRVQTPDLRIDGVTTTGTLQYLALDYGLAFVF